LRVQEDLALARRASSSSAARLTAPSAATVAVQAVDLALQARQAHAAFGHRLRHGFQVGLGVGQQLGVLLQPQAGGLLLELHVGDALAQRVQFALQLQAAFVAGAQLGGQVVVFAALGAQPARVPA
jgi:hypothetical protein